MNATLTYNGFAAQTAYAAHTAHTAHDSLLSAIKRFFAAVFATRNETSYGLPADMAARLYL